MRDIDAYIICDSIWYVLFSEILSIFVDLYAQVLGFSMFQWNLFSKLYGFGKVIKLSYNPRLKHAFGLRPLRLVYLLLELRELKVGFL